MKRKKRERSKRKKTRKEGNNRSKEGSGRMGDLGQRRSSKV